ncbi:Pao retrotransposon peptidase family protein-like protein [Aphelenchoides avenae]|nr:Pao retrotransposon peptidase family protein-like protein [Aphelenchus avenae]
MAGTSTMFQRTYEDRAFEYRRHIEFLIRRLRLYQDQFQDLQPTLEDDGQRLSHLTATINNIIAELQQYVTDYNEAADKWRQLTVEFELAGHRDTDDWACQMYHAAETFFQQPELHPTALDAQLVQLINDYRDLLDAVTDHASLFDDPVIRAGFEREASTPSESPAAARQPAAAVNNHMSPPPNSDSAPLAADEDGAQSLADQPHTTPRPQVTINEDPRRHFYAYQSDDSSSSSRTSLITTNEYYNRVRSPRAQQPPVTHRDVPIVQQLDHGDNTPLSASPEPDFNVYRYTPRGWDAAGVMAYADSNVAETRSIAWQPGRTDTPSSATIATPRDPGPLAPLANRSVGVNTRPTRTATPPPSRSTTPPPRQLVKNASTTTGARELPSLFLREPPVDTSRLPPRTTVTSEPQGHPATAPTTEALTESEVACTFYRKATFHRDTKDTPLVLKELPITLFDGDIRKFPTFRNRFLDVVEGYRDLGPRHKLQYLLQFLRGEPLELANNYPITDESYYVVLDLLEDQYGNEDMIRNLLMADLIGLRSPVETVSDLRRFYGEAFRVTNSLKQLGDDVDSNRLYEQTLMSKLTGTLKLELIRNSDYIKEKTTSSILRGLHHYVQVLESSVKTGSLFTKTTTGDHCPLAGGRLQDRAHHATRAMRIVDLTTAMEPKWNTCQLPNLGKTG